MLLESHEQSESKSLMYAPLQAQPALAVPSSFTQELVVFSVVNPLKLTGTKVCFSFSSAPRPLP